MVSLARTASPARPDTAQLCLRVNCHSHQRKRSVYCSSKCVERKNKPKKLPKPKIQLNCDCLYCNASIAANLKFCNMYCKHQLAAVLRPQKMHNNSFVKYCIRNCKRAGTVEVIPNTFDEWDQLHRLWKSRNKYNGYSINADGTKDTSMKYVLCHQSAAYTRSTVGLLLADNLVLGTYEQNAKDSNLQSVHNGLCLQKDKLLPKWSVSREKTFSDYPDVLNLMYLYSPSLHEFVNSKVTKTNPETDAITKVHRLNVYPKTELNLIQKGSVYYKRVKDSEGNFKLRVHKGFEQPPADAETVLRIEFERMGHNLTQFYDDRLGLRTVPAFQHLMWTAKVVTPDYNPIDELSLEFDVQTFDVSDLGSDSDWF